MAAKHQAQYIDHGFGFPVILEGVSMVKVRGHWTPNIDYNDLAMKVLLELARLRGRLSGNQVKFIRLHFKFTLQRFAERFDLTHPAVLKWENAGNNPTGMNWSTEKDLRMLITIELKGSARDLVALYNQLEAVTPERPVKVRVDAQKLAA